MKAITTNKDNAPTPTPALFHKKTKSYTSTHLPWKKGKGEEHKSNIILKKIELESPTNPKDNYVEKPRHYPPANKEWFNSIYTYGKATQKLAPTLDKVTQKLVKGYLDFYSDKLEGRVKPITKRMRRWARRLSTNRILISRAELKHTNDRVVVTVYVYNRQKDYYQNKIAGLGAIVKAPTDSLEIRERFKVVRLQSQMIKSSMAIIRDRIQKQIKVVTSVTAREQMNDNPNQADLLAKNHLEAKAVLWLARTRNYEKSYLKNYVSRSLRKQMLSIYILQLISFNSSKFDSKYLLPLTNLVRRVYSAPGDGSLQQKEVSFNFVNLKYPYLNSSLLSSILVAKIKNRKTKLLTVLRASLAMYEVPRLEEEQKATLYKNRQRRLPNIKIDEDSRFLPALMENATPLKYDTTIDRVHLMSKLSDPRALVNTTLGSIKAKAVTGIRLEVAGRLTRRYTAARSLFKLRYKGNLKNMDASNKGLSAVLLRGHARSGLGYTQTSSRVRIGSFGVKGWVSSG